MVKSGSMVTGCPDRPEHRMQISHRDATLRPNLSPKLHARQPKLVYSELFRASDEEGFIDLVQRALDRSDRHEPLPRDFAETLLYGMDGVPASRDFPEQVAQLTLSWCCLTDADLERMAGYDGGLPDIEPEFGLASYVDLAFFPASAIRGPFLTLLRSHPAIGIQLVLDLVNHAGHWYGERKWPAARLEPARLITISVPGHGGVEQWANGRLWDSHRGTSVSPPVIDCSLMALEAWLLGLCEGTQDIEPLLLKILLESNSVMTTAVVAGVCNAYPERCGIASLALLTSRQAIEMDRARIVKEPPSTFLMDLQGPDPLQRFYNDERKRSNALGHRSHDLEALAWKLQVGGKAEETWQIIDAHRAQIPDEDGRTDDDRAWLLALHRMDIRNYEAEAQTSNSEYGVSESESEKGKTISFKSKGIDADLQRFVDVGTEERRQFFAASSLMGWGFQQWERRADGGDADSWRTALIQAMEARKGEAAVDHLGVTSSGPGVVAAVCARDHWEELGANDRKWCLDTLIAEVERDSDSDNHTTRISNDSMNADRHGAYILPKYLADDPENAELLNAVAKAITHQTVQVSLWAAEGAGQYLASAHKDLAIRCVGAIAMQANLLEKHKEQGNHDERRGLCNGRSAAQQVSTQTRDAFVKGAINAEEELAALDLTSWQGRYLSARVLSIFAKVPDLAMSRDFFTRAVRAVITSWTARRRDRNSSRDFKFEHDVMSRLASVSLTLPSDAALVCCRQFLDAVEKHPKEVATFVELLITQEDLSYSGKSCFWDIWKAFADRVVDAQWLPSIDRDYSREIDLINKMLFWIHWNEGIRRWRCLDGHEQEVDNFTTRLPAAALVLLAYSHYLYKIGEGALPRAFMILANRLEVGNATDLLRDRNTVFCIESLLQRYVYGQPLRLRSDPMLRKAVLAILDELVDAGSSAAYRMRDDFVTPMSFTKRSG